MEKTITDKNTQEQAVLVWLLDEENPGVCYLALRDLMEYPADHLELVKARKTAH